MTIYFDKPADVDESEELSEEDKLKLQRATAVAAIAMLLWRVVVTPIVFFLLWNSILTPTFGIAKIGYLKSLGVLVMASIVLGNVKLEKSNHE